MAKRSKLVTLDIIDEIGIVSIDNGSQNLIDDAEFLNLTQFSYWVTATKIKGLIITGNKRHFSAGANLEIFKKLHDDKEGLREVLRRGRAILDYISSLSIPVVVAIKGICFGGGLEIALSGHIRIGTQNSLYAFPESNHNIMPGFTGTIALTELIGKKKAMEMILSGEPINEEEALQVGLIDYVVPKKELMDFSLNYLRKLTSGKPLAVITSIMSSLHNQTKCDRKTALETETNLFLDLVINNFNPFGS